MLYGLLTGVFIASYTVVDGYAGKMVFMSPILLDYFGNFVRLAFLLPALLRKPDEARVMWRAQWKYATVVGVIKPYFLCDGVVRHAVGTAEPCSAGAGSVHAVCGFARRPVIGRGGHPGSCGSLVQSASALASGSWRYSETRREDRNLVQLVLK